MPSYDEQAGAQESLAQQQERILAALRALNEQPKRAYTVVVEGRSREVYLVEATSGHEARQIWSEAGKRTVCEIDDVEVVSVTEGP
jgi:hypothetical protein